MSQTMNLCLPCMMLPWQADIMEVHPLYFVLPVYHAGTLSIMYPGSCVCNEIIFAKAKANLITSDMVRSLQNILRHGARVFETGTWLMFLVSSLLFRRYRDSSSN